MDVAAHVLTKQNNKKHLYLRLNIDDLQEDNTTSQQIWNGPQMTIFLQSTSDGDAAIARLRCGWRRRSAQIQHANDLVHGVPLPCQRMTNATSDFMKVFLMTARNVGFIHESGWRSSGAKSIRQINFKVEQGLIQGYVDKK